MSLFRVSSKYLYSFISSSNFQVLWPLNVLTLHFTLHGPLFCAIALYHMLVTVAFCEIQRYHCSMFLQSI
jgi:hypothetical protein